VLVLLATFLVPSAAFSQNAASSPVTTNVTSGTVLIPARPKIEDQKPMPARKDWRWVQGAVFVPTNVVNEAQEWDEYDPAINDRELRYASIYGINCVRVYLHYDIYLKKKDTLLQEIEDFLTRADKYHIKVEFVFFDSCWNNPTDDILKPDYVYPAPLYGVHNSRWLKSPSEDLLNHHYDEKKDSLKAYVQDIVNAHKDDPRIAFWETYNEPDKKSDAVSRLMADALQWVHETGTSIPVTATGGQFKGDAYSDFKSWHQYDGKYALKAEPITSLCTECMNRKDQSVPGVVSNFKGKVGFIVWEFGIGRDNCRFRWDQDKNHAANGENAVPFHGMVYPDGHPWSVDDVKALLGDDAFAKAPLFKVQYYRDSFFTDLAKESVTPMIDFDLNSEKGTNVPDGSVKMPDSGWSVRWTGTIVAPRSGDYVFTVDGDSQVKITSGNQTLINKTDSPRTVLTCTATLPAGQPIPIKIEYVHGDGLSSLHVYWSGPGLGKQPLTPQSG
jgi:hypothetical protein